MQQKNRHEQILRFQICKLWENINPGGNPENKRTKKKIDSQNVHRLFARCPIFVCQHGACQVGTLMFLLAGNTKGCQVVTASGWLVSGVGILAGRLEQNEGQTWCRGSNANPFYRQVDG